MSKYLLDSNVIIEMLRGNEKVRQRILKAGFDRCFISSITLAEIATGAYYRGIEQHQHELDFLRENFTIIPFCGAECTFGQIRAHLIKAGTPVDSMDIAIAATAINEKLTLVTHNTKDFETIPGLNFVDWQ